MPDLKPWEEQAAVVQAQYEAAVAMKDPDAPVPEPIASEVTEAKKKELISIQTMNKHMVFVMKKALSLAASSVGIKLPLDPVVDFLASINGLEMPPTGEAIVIKKLNQVLDKLKGIEEQQQDLLEHISREFKLQVVLRAKDSIWQIWEDINMGIKRQNQQKFYEAIARINSENVAGLLSAMHRALMSSEGTETDPLVQALQKKFQKQLLDTDDERDDTEPKEQKEPKEPKDHFTFDVLKYESSIINWRKQFVDIERMGTALLLLHEQCRDQKILYDKEGSLSDIVQNSEGRIKKIDDILLHKLRPSPSYQALLELAQVNVDKYFPRLWNLKIPNSDRMMVIDEKYSNPSNSENGGIYWPTFAEVNPDLRHITSKCFGLEHNPDGTWHIRCTRNLVNQYDGMPITSWETLAHDGRDQIFSTLPATRFKIAPVEHASDILIKLVVRRKDENKTNNDYKSVRLLQLIPTEITYPILGENTNQTTDLFRQHMDQRESSKNWFSVRNATRDHVLVFNNVISSGKYYYQNTVWLPGEDRMCLGAHGAVVANCCSAFKFTLYKIPDLQGKSLRDRVTELFCLLPRSGKPGLSATGAHPVCHLIVRTHVKFLKFQQNNISVYELDRNDDDAELIQGDFVHPKGLWENLGQRKVFQNEDGNFSGDVTRTEIRIGGTNEPVGHVRVYDK